MKVHIRDAHTLYAELWHQERTLQMGKVRFELDGVLIKDIDTCCKRKCAQIHGGTFQDGGMYRREVGTIAGVGSADNHNATPTVPRVLRITALPRNKSACPPVRPGAAYRVDLFAIIGATS